MILKIAIISTLVLLGTKLPFDAVDSPYGKRISKILSLLLIPLLLIFILTIALRVAKIFA